MKVERRVVRTPTLCGAGRALDADPRELVGAGLAGELPLLVLVGPWGARLTRPRRPAVVRSQAA